MARNRYGAGKRLKEIERKRKAEEKMARRQAKNKPPEDDLPEGAEQTPEGADLMPDDAEQMPEGAGQTDE